MWPVAGQSLPEPFVPGSGDKLPAELRLVLARYVGIACGLFAVALTCATVFAFYLLWLTVPNISLPTFLEDDYVANDLQGMLFGWAYTALWVAAGAGAWLGAVKGVQALKACIRFSRLLRQPSDPRTATVTASKRGGRTLILDTTPGGYQPLSEVRLALWTKAEMLMPGERVTVYGSPGSKNPLLVSSAQRGRAFLGTETSRSTVGAGPLDEKVSGATLVDWAAWAASTTFSSTGLGFGYDKREVDAFRSAVRDTFLGGAVFWVSTPPVRSDDLRGKQFSTHRRGYDKKQVDGVPRGGQHSGWPRWSRRTGRQDRWLAVPSLPGGPSGPTQRHSRPAGPMTLRTSTPSGSRFATRSSGQQDPR